MAALAMTHGTVRRRATAFASALLSAIVLAMPACDEQASRTAPNSGAPAGQAPGGQGASGSGSAGAGTTNQDLANQGSANQGSAVPGQPAPRAPEALPMQRVKIAGRTFNLELALDDRSRFRGLSDRTEIKEDGGMLFVMPRPEVQQFVMRDCPIPIDIIYLDSAGRVVSMYEMKPEPPRSEAEKKLEPPVPGAPEWAWINPAYEERLRKYNSRFPSQFIIELRGGTLPGLKLKEGDKIDLPIAELKRRAV